MRRLRPRPCVGYDGRPLCEVRKGGVYWTRGGTHMRRTLLVASIFAASFVVAQCEHALAAGFAWEEGDNETTLTYDGRPAMRYMHRRLDESSPANREQTIKPFHHVWS